MWKIWQQKRYASTVRKAASIKSRRPVFESLELRRMLAITPLFPGNAAQPDLNLSAVTTRTVTAGQPLTVNLFSLGATIKDLNENEQPTNDTIRYYLDPDVGTDTPTGATLSLTGVFTWTPTASQAGTHRIVVIAVDSGSPALADAEIFTIIVNPIAAPVVDLNGQDTGTGFNSTFVEDGGSISIVDTDLTVTDSDDTNLESARITLTNRPNGTDESLSVDVSGTPIGVSYNSTMGVLSLTGTATLTQYQQVLRTLKYNNVSQNPDTTARTVNITVNDGNADSTAAVATVAVQASNDLPVVDLNGSETGNNFEATFTEGNTPVAIVSSTATIIDSDNANLVSATISLSGLPDTSAEALAVSTGSTSIVANYSQATGVLTLTGSDTVTNYLQVLRTLTYSNSSQNPSTASRTVEILVNDGSGNSQSRTTTISVVGVNDAPLLDSIDDTTASVGTPLQITITASDPDGDNLTYEIDREDPADTSPLSATITKNSNNEAVITWTPSVTDGTGPFTFVVIVRDDDGTPLSDREEFVVILVPAPPTIDANGSAAGNNFNATFVESGGEVAIVSPELTVVDPDSANLQQVVVKITNLQDGTAESLSASTSGTTIQSNYDPTKGELVLSGNAPLIDYQSVLRTLKYNNTAGEPDTETRTVVLFANDGVNLGTVTTVSVAITATNDVGDLQLPSPYDDEQTPVEITLGSEIQFIAMFVDPDNAASQITFFLDLDHSGILPISAQPTITTPPDSVPGGLFHWAPNAIGTFVITIVATDPFGLPDQETFTVIVTAPDAVPPLEDKLSTSLATIDEAFEQAI